MNIRALTGFIDPGSPPDGRRIGALAGILKAARARLEEGGYTVQTLRLATPPPSEMGRPVPPAARAEFAAKLEAECFVSGIDYASLGPALPDEADGAAAVVDILGASENVFTSAIYCDLETGLSLTAARSCAQAIRDVSRLAPDGFANLRFAALANVPPGTPFFPAAYHAGGETAIAVATEAAELAVDALRDVSSIGTARRRLVGMIDAHAAALTRPLQALAAEHEIRFLGIDFSLAPYPDHFRSIGTAFESFGASAAGSGAVAAAAFLADCLDRADFRRTGFCGLFLPVLEDEMLAAHAAEGGLTINDLLLLSAVCGAGLDTLPLPGDAGLEALTGILLDLGALALRLNKPLTARLMPIPGKSAGDEVRFDFPYFAASRVMGLRERPLGELMAGGVIDLAPRRA